MQTGNDAVSMVAVGTDGVAFRGRITDYGNSTYLVEYVPTNSGKFLMYVSVGCCPPHPNIGLSAEIGMLQELLINDGKPFQLTVQPAAIDPSRSIITGQGSLGGDCCFFVIFTPYF